MMSAAYSHCVIGLLTSIVWTLAGQAGWYITDIVYLLDVLVVIVYMSFCNCWDYLLLHEDWGECSEDWAGACRWGGGGVEFLTEKKCSAKKCSWGPKTQKLFFFFFKNNIDLFFGGGGGFWGVWGAPRPHPGVARGRKAIHFFLNGHDMWPVKILERSGLAVKSYHPETLAAEE